MPSPPTPAKSKRWIAGVVTVVLCAGAIAGGWMARRSVQAARETAAQRSMTPPSPAPAGDAAAVPALANHLARLRAQVREHDAAFLRMQQQKALAWNIHERADIERDRQIVRDFLTTNARLTNTLQNGEGLIRAELETAKVPAAVQQSALALYERTEGPMLPSQMRVRHWDQVLGENAMAVLELLDFNWGEWRRDEATGRLDFTNTVTLAAFQDYVGKIEAAAIERKQAEEALITYQKHRPQP